MTTEELSQGVYLGDEESDLSKKLWNQLKKNSNPMTILSLIAKKADVNITDIDNTSTISLAVDHGVAKMLIKQKADVNRLSVHGETPLSNACKKGDLARVKLLVDHGAHINPHITYPHRIGVTRICNPLYQAFRNRHVGIVRYLLRIKADPLRMNQEGSSIELVDAWDRGGVLLDGLLRWLQDQEEKIGRLRYRKINKCLKKSAFLAYKIKQEMPWNLLSLVKRDIPQVEMISPFIVMALMGDAEPVVRPSVISIDGDDSYNDYEWNFNLGEHLKARQAALESAKSKKIGDKGDRKLARLGERIPNKRIMDEIQILKNFQKEQKFDTPCR
uniref:Uncharacterized protein n=1 Tax=Amorphochlora amoebiformis TaxID=1561963 RepID=A0A7S0CZC4_9EUKA